MKLTEKAAVRLSDDTPIAYLLSAPCICAVCTWQELALSGALVLHTTGIGRIFSRGPLGDFSKHILGGPKVVKFVFPNRN